MSDSLRILTEALPERQQELSEALGGRLVYYANQVDKGEVEEPSAGPAPRKLDTLLVINIAIALLKLAKVAYDLWKETKSKEKVRSELKRLRNEGKIDLTDEELEKILETVSK